MCSLITSNAFHTKSLQNKRIDKAMQSTCFLAASLALEAPPPITTAPSTRTPTAFRPWNGENVIVTKPFPSQRLQLDLPGSIMDVHFQVIRQTTGTDFGPLLRNIVWMFRAAPDQREL
jgi:hypothetical protein